MIGEGLDRRSVIDIRIGVAGPNDDASTAAFATRRQHRGRQSNAVHIAQCQKQRHRALDMRFLADFLLDIDVRQRAKTLAGPLAFPPVVFFDSVPHLFRFGHGLCLSDEAEPGFIARRVANVFHAGSVMWWMVLGLISSASLGWKPGETQRSAVGAGTDHEPRRRYVRLCDCR